MVRIATRHRMIFKLTEMPGKRHMLRPRDVLIAEEYHLVLEQQRLDLGDQLRLAGGHAQIDVAQLCADGAGELLDLDRAERGGARRGSLLSCRRHRRCSAHSTKIDEPVVFRASRFWCARTASSSA